MQIDLRSVRVIGIMAGVITLLLYLVLGGSLSNPSVIQIDFAMYPEDFEGLDVEIDGKVVGKLQKYGQRMVSGFEVDKGVHLVRIDSPDVGCPPIKVTVDESEKVRLMLDYGSIVNENGRSTTIITALGQ